MDIEKYDKNMPKSDSEVGQSSSLDTNTSLADFKSPKTKLVKTLKQFNFKLETNKKKETKLKTKSNKALNKKTSISNQLKTNIFHTPKQTESSTSMENNESTKLPNDAKIAYVCPLCFKTFKDTNSKTLHMKNCATKNNVSMKQLLQAMELQERQSAERVSLGLLAAPVLQNKKQTTINKMFSTKDPQLELALALSKSLYEVEEAGSYDEIEILYSSKDSVMELKDKDPIETSRMQKKKKSSFVTVLQTRSKEERDRLITERIAEILIDSQTFNQSQELETKRENSKKNNLRSRTLKKYLDFDSKLWNSAMLQQNQEDFYVMDLSPYVIPSTKQIFMEIESDSNIANEPETKDLLPTKSDLYFNKKESANISPKADGKVSLKTEKENISMQSSINTLILDWGNALNNSSSSDTIIFVNDGKHIWVHKLVFYIRCSNILLDIIPNNNTTYSVKEMINWADIEYHIALAFLEFIYCGIIKKHAITLTDKIAMSSLGRLARRYKVKELFTYLRHEYAILHDKTSENYEFELDDHDIQEICNNDDVNCMNQSIPNISQMEISHDELLKTIMISPKKNSKSDSHLDRENSMSPDIFNDTNDVQVNHTNMDNLNKNLDVLLSSIQSNSEINTNQIFSSTVNKSKSSVDECVLIEPLTETARNSQSKQSSNIITDKIRSESDLILFIKEVQRENDISDFDLDSDINSSASFIEFNGNPFIKKIYDKSSGLDKLHISKLSSDQGEKKEGFLSKLENDMQNDANKNPQLYNITIDLTRTSPTEHNRTDLLSPTKKIRTSCTYNDKHLLEKMTLNSQVNSTFTNTSYRSSSEMDTDDPDVHTKNKRKLDDNSIATCRSASKKYKNDTTKIKIDEIENTRAIASNSDKVENEVEIYDILKNNSYQHKDNFKEQEIDHWDNDCEDIFNLVSPEISDIENEQVSPSKSSNPNSILVSSTSEINVDSEDIDDFNKDENISFVRSKLHDSDYDLHYNFSNEIRLSNINIDDRTEHTVLDKNALHVSSRNKILRRKCKSEENLQMNYVTEENDQIDKFNIKEDNHKLFIKNKFFTITENDDTAPPNYNIMNTPELHKEMEKYGLKVQSRNKTIKLLTYIYNELHPTIDLCKTMDTSAKNMFNEHEEPQQKGKKADISLSDKYNNTEYGCSVTLLKKWNSNYYDKRTETSGKYINSIENSITLDDCVNIKEAFSKLIEFNKDLHNKILQYEPLNIEWLHQILKTGGFKCKMNAVIDFLDEQCITFYIPESKTKNRSRR